MNGGVYNIPALSLELRRNFSTSIAAGDIKKQHQRKQVMSKSKTKPTKQTKNKQTKHHKQNTNKQRDAIPWAQCSRSTSGSWTSKTKLLKQKEPTNGTNKGTKQTEPVAKALSRNLKQVERREFPGQTLRVSKTKQKEEQTDKQINKLLES